MQWERLSLFEMQIGAIHAGLECGLLGAKIPGLDMVSYGPHYKVKFHPLLAFSTDQSQTRAYPLDHSSELVCAGLSDSITWRTYRVHLKSQALDLRPYLSYSSTL